MKNPKLTFDPPEVNGCGPHWIPVEWKDAYFKSECNLHDKDYNDGTDRRRADKAFYHRMIARIETDAPNVWTRWGRRIQAFFFYQVVRRLGWTSHKEGLDL